MADSADLETKEVKPNNISASDLAAGGGIGGALIFVVNTYVPDPKLQTLLVYLIPTASIVALGMYSFILEQFRHSWESFEAERTRKRLLRRAQEGLLDAKSQLKAIEADNNSTAEHKAIARERVQKFERAVLDLHAKGIVVID
jgi:hypothetical protein